METATTGTEAWQVRVRRSDALCARLKALGVIAHQQSDGELSIDLGPLERLVSLAEAGARETWGQFARVNFP